MVLTMEAMMATTVAAVTTSTLRVAMIKMKGMIAIVMAAVMVAVQAGAMAVTVKERVAAVGEAEEGAWMGGVVEDTAGAERVGEEGAMKAAAVRGVVAEGKTR